MFSTKASGFKELDQALSELQTHTSRRAVGRRALKEAAAPIEQVMQDLAPDDPNTGAPLDLASSIARSSRQKSGRATKFRKASPTEQVVHIGPTKDGYPQAIMQEFGTKHHAAQPYMRPAWDREGGKRALARIRKFFKLEIAKAVGRQRRRIARKEKG